MIVDMALQTQPDNIKPILSGIAAMVVTLRLAAPSNIESNALA